MGGIEWEVGLLCDYMSKIRTIYNGKKVLCSGVWRDIAVEFSHD